MSKPDSPSSILSRAEQLLRSAAATCDRAAREGWTVEEMREYADDDMRASFALARAVLGEKEDTDG